MINKSKKIIASLILLLIFFSLYGCKDKPKKIPDSFRNADNYENIYEVFVRSYADSNFDGIGDFKGIENKLEYIKDLGFTAIWLMPINESPSYHGYDVTDYFKVNPDYGTLEDFKSLLAKASTQGIDIYMDLVINHSSNEHEWFKKALKGESPYKDYYVFNTKKGNYWHPASNGKNYFGYFSPSMPDLNLKNEAVKAKIKEIASFWCNMGVKGFRLDGALHYYRTDEYNYAGANYVMGVSFIQELNTYMQSINPDFNIIVEAWDKYLGYAQTFRSGASPIDFDLSELILDTASSSSSSKFFYTIETMYKKYASYSQDYVPVPFIKNHDMDRLASTAGFTNDVNQKMAAEILFSMPGSPIVYYGEELGMKGIRANGANNQYDETVRLPYVFEDESQTSWTTDYNNYNSSIQNVSEQLANQNSILNTFKRLLNVRNNNIALKYGNSITKLSSTTNNVLCYTRTTTFNNKTQTVLVIHNLANSSQPMIDCSGTVIYASNQIKTLDGLSNIPAKTTLIIDITKGYAK